MTTLSLGDSMNKCQGIGRQGDAIPISDHENEKHSNRSDIGHGLGAARWSDVHSRWSNADSDDRAPQCGDPASQTAAD
jgi:hypothetical protein